MIRPSDSGQAHSSRTFARILVVLVAVFSAGACAVEGVEVEGEQIGSASSELCSWTGCDDEDPAWAAQNTVVAPTWVAGRTIRLHLSFADQMGWATIENGFFGDEVWLDRSFDAGHTWEPMLGYAIVRLFSTGQHTNMYAFTSIFASGMLRACGRVGSEISCTPWLPVCDAACDGRDPALAGSDRTHNPLAWAPFEKKITLHIASGERMGWASIDGAAPGDVVWLDRSWDSGITWEPRLSSTVTPSGFGGWRTWMFSFDDPTTSRAGLLRACGWPAPATDPATIRCTPFASWTNGVYMTEDFHREAARWLADVQYDTTSHLWIGDSWIQWWGSANAVTALVDYTARTGSCEHWSRVQEVFDRNRTFSFINEFYDDTAWWDLAWLRAYQVSDLCAPGDWRKAQYLQTAIAGFDWIKSQWGFDPACHGGGVRWQWGSGVMNAISNELFFQLAADLHAVTQDPSFLAWASEAYGWLLGYTHGGQRHLLQADDTGLIRDGVSCFEDPAQDWTFTYDAGPVIGALVALYAATNDAGYLDEADSFALATTTFLSRNGILQDQCEAESPACSGNSHDGLFKGIFVRNLRRLYDQDLSLGRSTYGWESFLAQQRASIIASDRSAWAEFGHHWAGPILDSRHDTFATQTSALDLFNAAFGLAPEG